MKSINKSILAIASVLQIFFFYSCQKDDPDKEDDIISKIAEYSGGSFKMIYCPGGTFLTNDDDRDSDYEEGPEVTVDPFWIS